VFFGSSVRICGRSRLEARLSLVSHSCRLLSSVAAGRRCCCCRAATAVAAVLHVAAADVAAAAPARKFLCSPFSLDSVFLNLLIYFLCVFLFVCFIVFSAFFVSIFFLFSDSD